eukprot:m.46192 g.46192  ORF g.46192 m.46192 type:complete len:127 (-) comp7255_c1_seq1:2834-3214(-)
MDVTMDELRAQALSFGYLIDDVNAAIKNGARNLNAILDWIGRKQGSGNNSNKKQPSLKLVHSNPSQPSQPSQPSSSSLTNNPTPVVSRFQEKHREAKRDMKESKLKKKGERSWWKNEEDNRNEQWY